MWGRIRTDMFIGVESRDKAGEFKLLIVKGWAVFAEFLSVTFLTGASRRDALCSALTAK